MNHAPKVTVLLSVYNGERRLAAAIDSILGQSFGDFEFLIVDDGSTDASRDIIDGYDDPRLRLVVNEQNRGIARSLNRGLALARGHYLARQDADDVSEPQRLARQVAYLDANPRTALVGCWYREIDDNDRMLRKARLPRDYTELRWALLFYCPFVHSGVTWRRALVTQAVGLYDEGYGYAEDHDLWLRIARRFPVANLPRYLVRYRASNYSATATYGPFSAESVAICAGALAALLEASPPGVGTERFASQAYETLYRQLFSLLYETDAGLTLSKVRRLTALVWQLHGAFCRQHGLSAQEAQKHARRLGVWLSRRAIYHADRMLANGDVQAGKTLLVEGCRQAPRNVFRVRTLMALQKLIQFQLRTTNIRI